MLETGRNLRKRSAEHTCKSAVKRGMAQQAEEVSTYSELGGGRDTCTAPGTQVLEEKSSGCH